MAELYEALLVYSEERTMTGFGCAEPEQLQRYGRVIEAVSLGLQSDAVEALFVFRAIALQQCLDLCCSRHWIPSVQRDINEVRLQVPKELHSIIASSARGAPTKYRFR